MRVSVVRFDAPFWVVLVALSILVGSVGFFGLAAAAQDAAKSGTIVVCAGRT